MACTCSRHPPPTAAHPSRNCLANQLALQPPLHRQYLESERASVKGHKLFTVTFLPDAAAGPPSAVLCWHHGVAEHIGRYRQSARGHSGARARAWGGRGRPCGWRLARLRAGCCGQAKRRQPLVPTPATPSPPVAVFSRFAEQGVAVYSGDIVGHGHSEGHRALMESYPEAVRWWRSGGLGTWREAARRRCWLAGALARWRARLACSPRPPRRCPLLLAAALSSD